MPLHPSFLQPSKTDNQYCFMQPTLTSIILNASSLSKDFLLCGDFEQCSFITSVRFLVLLQLSLPFSCVQVETGGCWLLILRGCRACGRSHYSPWADMFRPPSSPCPFQDPFLPQLRSRHRTRSVLSMRWQCSAILGGSTCILVEWQVYIQWQHWGKDSAKLLNASVGAALPPLAEI